MNCRLLEKNESGLLFRRRMLPVTFSEEIDSLYIFGGFDINDRLVAIAAFSDCPYNKRVANLRHIYVEPMMREIGLAKELLMLSMAGFKELGIIKYQYECITDSDNSLLYYKLLTALGFRPAKLNQPVYYYRMGHFKGDKTELLYKNISKLKLTFSNSLEYTDIRVRRFMELHESTGIFIAEEDYDKECVVYALKGDNIVAALCLHETIAHDFVCEGMYISDELKEGLSVVPFMMAYLAENFSRERKPEHGIYVTYQREEVKAAVDSVFGAADDKFNNQKYILQIKL